MEGRRLAALGALLRWLGPWTRSDALPPGVAHEIWLLRPGARPGRRGRKEGLAGPRDRLEAHVFHPHGPPVGTYLVAPGIHFDGPEDPRFERFCRILAHAGFLVVAPTLPAFAEQVIARSVVDDFELVARALAERLGPGRRFALFSISFGSWPALEVAARMPEQIAGVITFGGYAEFESAVRFAVDGVMRRPEGDLKLARDPLNQPALFLNVLPWLDVPGDTGALQETWREMMFRTWGRMELKAPGRLEPIADELAPRVPAEHRELFRVGCGTLPGGAELVEAALARAGNALAFASPTEALRTIRSPVWICHGRDDDVIPWGEAEKLQRALEGRVPTRLLLTGLYGHTATSRPSPALLAREVSTLVEMMLALAGAGAER
ncbi:MAG: alpha/beta hydrolase [Polyangiaceae bacterium]